MSFLKKEDYLSSTFIYTILGCFCRNRGNKALFVLYQVARGNFYLYLPVPLTNRGAILVDVIKDLEQTTLLESDLSSNFNNIRF